MYAIEFETDINSEYIRLPEFEKLKNKHVRVIVLSEETDSAIEPVNPLKTQQMQTIVNQARESGISETSLQQMKQQFIANTNC
jgi:virulence-associated protein VagC